MSLAREQRLREALAGLEQFFRRPGEGPTEAFERIGDAFYREKHMLRPGKSQADALCGTPSDEERRRAYDAWVQGYLERARAALKHDPINDDPSGYRARFG